MRDKHIIFSYGSNMSEKELNKYKNKLKNPNKIHFELLDVCVLKNHKFSYENTCYPKVKKIKATVVPTKNRKVYGTAVEVSDELFNLILKKEGVLRNVYRVEIHPIHSLFSNKKYKAKVFVMNETASPSSGYPSMAYEKTIVNAAKYHNFPSRYINKYLKVSRERK